MKRTHPDFAPPDELWPHVPHRRRLYSVQHVAVAEALTARQRVRPAPPAGPRNASFDEAYAWMAGQVAERLDSDWFDPSDRSVFWAWASCCRDELVLSCRYGAATGSHVLLTLDVDQQRVVLSDHGRWQDVLALEPVWPPEPDAAPGRRHRLHPIEVEGTRRLGRVWDWSLASAAERDAVRATWRNVFVDDVVSGRATQACLAFLDPDDVVDVAFLDDMS